MKLTGSATNLSDRHRICAKHREVHDFDRVTVVRKRGSHYDVEGVGPRGMRGAGPKRDRGSQRNWCGDDGDDCACGWRAAVISCAHRDRVSTERLRYFDVHVK